MSPLCDSLAMPLSQNAVGWGKRISFLRWIYIRMVPCSFHTNDNVHTENSGRKNAVWKRMMKLYKKKKNKITQVNGSHHESRVSILGVQLCCEFSVSFLCLTPEPQKWKLMWRIAVPPPHQHLEKSAEPWAFHIESTLNCKKLVLEKPLKIGNFKSFVAQTKCLGANAGPRTVQGSKVSLLAAYRATCTLPCTPPTEVHTADRANIGHYISVFCSVRM